MAKKKSSKPNRENKKEFSSSPFKSLKGLSAFADSKPLVSSSAKQTDSSVGSSENSCNDQESFAEEMQFLGVKALPGSVLEDAESAEEGPSAKVKSTQKPVREETDMSIFLDAVGTMETTFTDEWQEDTTTKKAMPRRMRQVLKGQLRPEAQQDLHGLTIAEASAKVQFFLQDSLFHGYQTVLVITGKGLHSSDGPVLRNAMEKLLNQHKHVVEWGLAPQRYGGEGALVVFLRKSSAE